MKPTQTFLPLILLTVTSCFLVTCTAKEVRPKYDRTDGCIMQNVYAEEAPFSQHRLPEEPDWSHAESPDVWLELLPGQETSYDKWGSVIQKVHYWPSGCWMVIERCKWTGTACAPMSGQKWRFGGCTWNDEDCIPKQKNWRNGSWVLFSPTVWITHCR
jgi:hypothetical protein